MMSVPSAFSDRGFAGFRLPAYSGPRPNRVRALWESQYSSSPNNTSRGVHSTFVELSGTYRCSVAPAAMILLAVLIVQHPLSSPRADGKLRIHFLDVGQGDSALVVFPDGETMLIDGGGQPNLRDEDDTNFSPDSPRIGEAVVSEFLWEEGYSRIDYVVATHADADHMQGLSDVAKNFEIGKLMVGSTPVGDPEYKELMRVANKRGIPITTVRRGDAFSVSGVTLRVLNPITNLDPGSQNNSSIVMKIEFGSRSFLMTGDIERTTEANLVADGCEAIRVAS
jgi:competence protein ComEC